MKKTLTVIGLALLLGASVFTSTSNAQLAASATGTAFAATNSWAVLPPPAMGSWESTYVNASLGQTGTGSIRWFTTSGSTNNVVLLGQGAATATNKVVICTNTLSAGDMVIYRQGSTCTRLYVSSVGTGTVTFTTVIGIAPLPGDTIYRCTPAGSVPVVALNKELNGIWLYGEQGRPLLVDVNDVTNTCTLNTISARAR